MDQLAVDVAQRYFDILLADDDVALLESELESVRKQLDEMQARYERKLAPVTEYLEARARADQVQADLIEAENRAALAREELAVLTGRRVEAIAPVRDSVDLPELDRSLAYWVEAAMRDNAELAGRREAIEAAKRGVEEARGAHLPTINFVASAQRSDVGFDNLRSPERDVIYLGVDVNLPLFTGGANSARLREAWSQYYVAREEEEGARREVLKRVRGAWLNAQASRRRLDAARLTVESATTAYEAISRALELGSAKTADVLEALARRTRAERDYREALYGYLFNWLSVKREGGALNPEELWRLDETVIAASGPPGPASAP
jgi:outer membrane protein